MANISDMIEQYILSTIGNDESLCISRNGLASFFNVAPSQINYVLSTRFSLERGYVIESRRGGGGYLTVIRLSKDKNKYIKELLESEIGDSISYLRAANVLKRLASDEVITDRETDIVLSCMNDKALFLPAAEKDKLRADMLKNVLQEILKHI